VLQKQQDTIAKEASIEPPLIDQQEQVMKEASIASPRNQREKVATETYVKLQR
jgi:hypothetical protein